MKRETLEVLAALCLLTLESHRVIFNYVQNRLDDVCLGYLKGDADIALKVCRTLNIFCFKVLIFVC